MRRLLLGLLRLKKLATGFCTDAGIAARRSRSVELGDRQSRRRRLSRAGQSRRMRSDHAHAIAAKLHPGVAGSPRIFGVCGAAMALMDQPRQTIEWLRTSLPLLG